MPVTRADLEEFHHFAQAKIANGGAQSLHELLTLWEIQRERDEVNAAIREGLADIEAGRFEDFNESMAAFRKQHNLPPHV